VSTSVARFRERGIVETHADPDDGRRTLVRATSSYVRTASLRGTKSADNAIAAALDGADPRTVRDVIAALESLADQLMPAARAQIERMSRTPPRRRTHPTTQENT
jgi:DNA-binding MarR family transcriptional regulator